MFGTKIRSWMEAQIARSRAKRKERKGVGTTQIAPQESEARAFEPKLFGTRPDYNEVLPALPISSSSFKPQRVSQHAQQQRQQQALKAGQQQYGAAGSAVNLSSPESAYSTGYSTDGTSPCATYAPEHYANVRDLATGKRRPEPQSVVGRASTSRTTQTGDRIDTTGTYSVSRGRLPEPLEYEQHPWRKPPPPTTSRPLVTSPKIQPGQLVRKPYSSPPVDLLQHQLSPRRKTHLTATTTQVMPIKSPRQRSRVRTNPWQGARSGSAMMTSGVARPWSRQQQHHDAGHPDHCYRQESLSVGRSSVNRTDWRNAAQLRQQQRQQQLRNNRTRSNSASSCSSSRSRSLSRSCSISSSGSSNSDSSNSGANASSRASDEITLNEVMGQFDENYPYDKETDIVSDHSGGGGCGDNSSSANFSSDMSVSSLDMQYDSRSRSASRYQSHPRGLSGCRLRRRKQRRGAEPKEDEEVELLQEVLSRRLRNNSSEASAQSNRALLERLLMKNAHSGFEGRRAWSANPAPIRPVTSRSVGGTPICLRRRISRPRNKLVFEKNHQVYPASLQESSSSLKNTSVSELALIEADREADLKYAQLIMEAERMLLSARQQLELEESPEEASSPRLLRGIYRKQRTALNRRVELIKNAELHTDLAFSKSRNSQPELSSGSIKDLLDHSSPKRLLQQQHKKMVDPVVSQTIASKRTAENNLPTFQSIDVKSTAVFLNAVETNDSGSSSGYSCPQSEPVKRKIYEGKGGGRMLLHQTAPWLRSSDGDCANEQQQQQQHQHHYQYQQLHLQSTSATSSYSQLRKHMLIETLQGLKQSLEDQSAALKINCLRPL